ncbi:MAG: hypothetical protein MJ211_00860 [Bacteroidales bacterium]|nr:hypothetical protein [Bacteroidales bacterium]
MKIFFILIFVFLSYNVYAQGEVAVASFGLQAGSVNPHAIILKNSNIKYKIPILNAKARLFVFSYNLKEKSDFFHGKTYFYQDFDSSLSHIFALAIDQNDICCVMTTTARGTLYIPFKREHQNINIILYPFEIQDFKTNRYIPLALVLNKKNNIPEDIINRVLSVKDTKEINKNDINYIKNNTTYFEILTFCVKTWEK